MTTNVNRYNLIHKRCFRWSLSLISYRLDSDLRQNIHTFRILFTMQNWWLWLLGRRRTIIFSRRNAVFCNRRFTLIIFKLNDTRKKNIVKIWIFSCDKLGHKMNRKRDCRFFQAFPNAIKFMVTEINLNEQKHAVEMGPFCI